MNTPTGVEVILATSRDSALAEIILVDVESRIIGSPVAGIKLGEMAGARVDNCNPIEAIIFIGEVETECNDMV